MARLLTRLIVLAIVAGLAAFLLFGIRTLEPSQRPLASLDAARLPAFTAQFDAARDSTRLLVLLSPT